MYANSAEQQTMYLWVFLFDDSDSAIFAKDSRKFNKLIAAHGKWDQQKAAPLILAPLINSS